ncbi:IclR family transcriptional regulator [Rhizobium ruizarguesonis]|uniref:IclR family transcriptional regulator n=1 Tax=Rhizobium ruizarguesonis TaxID=2081791 RepID=UPI001FDFC590|nr:IclR family transcriptional regulator [Rhizobium ruizarguesonis]
MMKSVDRALYLLSFFTVQEPEWGLSDLARKSKIDKATTLRILVALIRNGFVEQHSETKKYRLGIAVLRLARVREASFPLLSFINPVLDRLAEEMEETAHATLAAETAMITIAVTEPKRSTRVWVNPSQLLPFHASASGLAFLAFAGQEMRDTALAQEELVKYTENTVVEVDELRTRLEQIKTRGFAFSPGTFEVESSGIAAPIFSNTGDAFGAIAIAGVSSRMTTKDQQMKAARLVIEASVEISRAIGAEPHPNVLRARKELLDA